MRVASCIATVLCAVAAPALATSTISCRSTTSPTDGPALFLVVGAGGIVQARLNESGASFTTGQSDGAPMIAQSWLDRDQLKIDILDGNADERIVRLDTRRAGTGYTGILILHGRQWRVRCQESG